MIHECMISCEKQPNQLFTTPLWRTRPLKFWPYRFVVFFAAVLLDVTQRSSQIEVSLWGALHDIQKNGCEGD